MWGSMLGGYSPIGGSVVYTDFNITSSTIAFHISGSLNDGFTCLELVHTRDPSVVECAPWYAFRM